MKVVGYADRLSVEPGSSIGFMISSETEHYHASVVRLIHGDANPDGPGFKAEAVPSAIEGNHPGAVQHLRPGSSVHIPHRDGLDVDGSFTLQMWIRPTTPDKDRQTLIAKTAADGTAFELGLDAGCLTLRRRDRAGATHKLALEVPVALFTWYFVAATYNEADDDAALTLAPLPATAAELGDAAHAPMQPDADPPPTSTTAPTALTIAARPSAHDPAALEHFYNGKIDAPRLYRRPLSVDELDVLANDADPTTVEGLVAAWDFAADIPSSRVTDAGPDGHHGHALQRPTRGVTGHRWTGDVEAWPHAPDQYGAIHFHDDDLDDAGWQRSIEWAVPADMPSGVYALHLQAGDPGDPAAEDHIPFAVRPPTGQPTARILFLMPTFSHLAYANEHMLGTAEAQEAFAALGVDPATLDYPSAPQDHYILANRLNSLYDSHTDGSGVCYSSRLRPLVNMRPKYAMSALDQGHGSPHQLNADLHLIDWLHEQGYAFDVATDEDLYREGLDLLTAYKVVLTGTHHEYWAGSMLDALRTYLEGGGRMMYLAGNGFYWVTELEPERGHTIEIRRRGPATRTWDAAPGEGHLSATGEPGGLWRYRNRAPQQLVGVGFTAQGVGPGRPYQRQPESFDPRASWIFDGVGEHELIGDHPCLVSSYGAAGFEIDRLDHSLGSPHRTMRLATATGFSDLFQHVSEEVTLSSSLQGGTVNPLVRADMVLLEYPNDGAVFTPASITWCGSLSHNGYDNNVSRITANVLDRFMSDKPATGPA